MKTCETVRTKSKCNKHNTETPQFQVFLGTGYLVSTVLACHTPYIKDRVEFRELKKGAQEGAVKAREKEQERLL
jgi:hypothetical protein